MPEDDELTAGVDELRDTVELPDSEETADVTSAAEVTASADEPVISELFTSPVSDEETFGEILSNLTIQMTANAITSIAAITISEI